MVTVDQIDVTPLSPGGPEIILQSDKHSPKVMYQKLPEWRLDISVRFVGGTSREEIATAISAELARLILI